MPRPITGGPRVNGAERPQRCKGRRKQRPARTTGRARSAERVFCQERPAVQTRKLKKLLNFARRPRAELSVMRTRARRCGAGMERCFRRWPGPDASTKKATTAGAQPSPERYAQLSEAEHPVTRRPLRWFRAFLSTGTSFDVWGVWRPTAPRRVPCPGVQ